LSNYASTANSSCVMTYSLQNAIGNTTYTGSDLSISQTTGILSTKSSNLFTSGLLVITVTSTYTPCSVTV
jgi:hypothetical protein